nr:paraneoplastic antigen Ma6E-like isoform X1 [Pongo pygmaeus]
MSVGESSCPSVGFMWLAWPCTGGAGSAAGVWGAGDSGAQEAGTADRGVAEAAAGGAGLLLAQAAGLPGGPAAAGPACAAAAGQEHRPQPRPGEHPHLARGRAAEECQPGPGECHALRTAGPGRFGQPGSE